MEEYFEILLDSRLFAGVTAPDLRAMLGCLGARKREFDRGQDIFRPGEETRAIGLVLAGAVHIAREDFWGNRNILTAAGPGEVFGEAYACLPHTLVQVRATAAQRSVVLFLDAQRVLTTCTSACGFHNRLVRNLLEVLAARNLTMNEKLIHLTQRTTRDKVLSYLSAESVRCGSSRFAIPYNRQQLADYLSVDRSALSAELGRLRDQGVLEFEKNRFHLLTRPET